MVKPPDHFIGIIYVGHRMHVTKWGQRLQPRYQATCSCGWKSDHLPRHRAALQAYYHWRDERPLSQGVNSA